MEFLKKLFPLSWKFTKDVANLIIGIVVYVIAGIVAGALITVATMITGWIPALGKLIAWALGVVGSLIGIYVLVGIIVLILVYCKVIKD